MDGTVLIADDDRTIRTVLTQALSRAGCRVHATGSLSQLSKWVEEGRGDLVITDVVMPDGNGIDRIPAIHKARPDLPVIVISAQNTIVTAIRATEVAAFEYLPKPFDLPDLMAKAREAMALRKRKYDAEPKADATTQGAADPVMPLIGHAPAMQALFRMVARVLNADLPVLIQGEAGVGKSTIARSIHELSNRSERELVLLTSADASEANPGKLADRLLGGTIIIEHPAGFDSAAQARLIGLFETLEAGSERATPPRIVATAGSDPLADVSAGRLRSDLYYRLAGVTISVPPLRARVDDILPLANHLLARASVQGLPERELTAGAASLLRSYPFPGNIRELENMMRLLALTANDTEISEAEMREVLKRQGERAVSLSAPYRNDADTGEGVSQSSIAPNERLSEVIEVYLQRYFDLHGEDLPPPGLYSRFLRELELPLLQVAMDATGGNQLKCADLLGVNRNTLRKKLNELNIDVTRRRKLM